MTVAPDIDDADLDKNPRVNKGRTSVLFCPVTGNPTPEIIWLKDGEPLELDSRVTMEADGHELRIHNASVPDTAKYTCRARNAAGQDAVNFDLEVQGKICRQATTSFPLILNVHNDNMFQIKSVVCKKIEYKFYVPHAPYVVLGPAHWAMRNR